MSNPKAVLTGATVPGYGQAIADRLLLDGYDVIGTYVSEDKDSAAEFSAKRDRLDLYEVNLDRRGDLANFVETLRDVEVKLLVFSQFFWNMEDPENFDHDAWDRSIAFNLTAVNYLVHELKDRIVSGGSIVIITSTEGLTGSFGGTAYAAARAAEHNLTKSLANNLGQRNIRVNALAAGWIGSVMDTDDIFNVSRGLTPLRRLGEGKEIASVVSFLASPDASFVNGQVVIVDGGYSGVDYMAKYEFEQSQNGDGQTE